MRINPLHCMLFSLFLLLTSPFVPGVNDAYAKCCMCGTCSGNCTCPGVGICAWCAAPSPEDLRVTAKFSDRTLDSTTLNEPMPSIDINSHSIDRLIRLAGRNQCGRPNYRLTITSGEKPLAEVFLSAYVMEEQAAKLELAANGNK